MQTTPITEELCDAATATTLGWHFTAGNRLRDGQPVPPVGEWLVHEGPVKICEAGLHFSERVIDALAYAPGATLHRVEVRGVVENHPLDKGVARERRILKTYSAENVLPVLVRFSWACAWRAQEHAAAAADAAATFARDAAAARAAAAATTATATAAAADDAAATFARDAAIHAAVHANYAAEREVQEQLFLAGLAALEREAV